MPLTLQNGHVPLGGLGIECCSFKEMCLGVRLTMCMLVMANFVSPLHWIQKCL